MKSTVFSVRQFLKAAGISLAAGVMVASLSRWSNAQTASPNAPSIVRQGYTLLQRGWVEDAIATFRQAVQRYPQSLEAQLGLAIAYQRAGEDSNAWQAYQRVLQQDPANRSALTAVGTLGGYRAEWQRQGIEALTALLELNPSDQVARAQRALLYGYQGQFLESLADYDVVLAANPTPEVLLGAAQIYTYSGNFEQAVQWFDRYQATGNRIPINALADYALALQKTGNPAEAVALLEPQLASLTTLNETALQVRSVLAVAYQATGQSQEALAVLEPLRNQENATLPLARALSTIGRDRGDGGLYEEAIGLYRQALAAITNPSVGLLTEVADVYSESAVARAEALPLYQQAIEQQPDNRSLQVKRSIVEYQLGRLTQPELETRLQAVVEPLPTALIEQQAIGSALLRLDPPAVNLLPTYQALAAAVPFLNFRVAQIELQQGNLAAARQALAIYQTSATEPGTELLLAEIDRREGNVDQSIERYEAVLASNPNATILQSAVRGLAGIRLSQGQPAEALALYDRLLAANPDDPIGQLGRASVAYPIEQISAAETETVLDQWLSTNPLTNPPPELLSLVAALPPDPARLELYNSLLAIEPDNIGVNRRWAQVRATENPQEVLDRINQLAARNPDDINVYFVQGELAQTIGELELAGQAYDRILEKQPDNADALSALAGVRFQQRRYPVAARLYQRVLALNPENLETQRALAELNVAQDQPLLALEQFRRLQQAYAAANNADAQLDRRIEELEFNLLRRRGFQPYWERY